MNWLNDPYLAMLALAAGVTLLLAFRVWQRRLNPAAPSFVLLMLAVSAWCIEHALEMTAGDLSAKVFWANMQFFSIDLVPVFWLTFITHYTGRSRWLTRRRLFLLMVIPSFSLIMVWSNPFHGFFFSNLEIISKGNFSILFRSFNAGFWIHTAYSYALLLISTFWLVQFLVQAPKPYRIQSALILAGALFPWLGNALYIFEIGPLAYLDLTPFAFAVSGLCFAVGVFQLRLLNIVPIAYDAIISSMDGGIVILDTRNQIVYLNPAAQKITGLRTADIFGKSAATIFSAWHQFFEAGREKMEWKEEVNLMRNNGPRNLSVRLSPLWRRKRFCGRLLVIRDITEKRKAEIALRKSEEMFKSLSENAPNIIFTLVADGSFSYVNPAWETLLGYTREEALGMYFNEFTQKEDADDYIQLFKRVIKKKETITDTVIRMLHKDRSIRIFKTSAAPNTDASGKVTGLVGSLNDITDQQKLENELAQARKMEAIGTLTGTVVNDFNNVFMAIQGNLSLMLKKLETDGYLRQKVKRIEESVDKGAELTRQLLSFVLGNRYVATPTDLNAIVKRTSNIFASAAKKIKIYKHYQQDLWPANVDPVQIGKVLLNIYENAGDAMSGTGELYIGTKNITLGRQFVKPFNVPPGRYVEISIRDTGIGMSESTKQRIFEPFFSTKAVGKGSGLGLSFAYGIIKNHGGFIDVHSREKKGSAFDIYLMASDKPPASRGLAKPDEGSGALRAS